VTRLTPREREVVELVAKGKSYAAVGRALKISEHTARVHARAVAERLRFDIPPKAALTRLYYTEIAI